jgi:hypothetical protein
MHSASAYRNRFVLLHGAVTVRIQIFLLTAALKSAALAFQKTTINRISHHSSSLASLLLVGKSFLVWLIDSRPAREERG